MADLTDAELGERLLREVFGWPDNRHLADFGYEWHSILAPERIHLLLAECERRGWKLCIMEHSDRVVVILNVGGGWKGGGADPSGEADNLRRALALAMLAAVEAER